MSAASDATGWIWDFGDGGSSTLENPVYTYAVGGTYAVTLIVTNACGSDTLSQILTSTAIDPAGLAAAVKVFPVPADERLFVGMLGLEQESFQCSLTDVQGRTIRTAVFKAGASERMLDWNVGDLSPGVYLLRIEGGGTQLSRKVLLAR
jgi:PKD repeat protein